MSDQAEIVDRPALRYIPWILFLYTCTLSTTWLMHDVVGWPEEVAVAIALTLVTIMSFFGLRHFVYRASSGKVKSQGSGYLLAVIFFRVVEYAGFFVFHTWLGIRWWLVLTCVLIASNIAKHFSYKLIVFRTK